MHTHFLPRTVKTGVPQDFVAWPYVDDLFDYTRILGPERTLATLPPESQGSEVAIVGAGVAGMVAAYELLRLGVRPVVFEATERVGGRGWSQPFTDGGAPTSAFAEMGAMRFPVRDKVFSYYARDRFALKTIPYPEPGTVPTLIYYANQSYRCLPGEPLPRPLQQIADAWKRFVTPLIDDIYVPWRDGDLGQVRQIWQNYIARYEDVSLFEAIAQGIPAWTAEDRSLFGATGAGTGGLGSLNEVGFLELLRFFIRFGQSEHLLFQDGINELTRRFYDQPVVPPDRQQMSLRALGAVRFNTPVTRIVRGPDGDPAVTFIDPGEGRPVTRAYRAVIVATSLRAMEVMGLTLLPDPAETVIAEPAKSSMRSLRLMNASKLFIRTATKFWKAHPEMPQTILTDELPGLTVALDYPQTDNGVVLVSYSWGPDANKLQGLDPRARFALFKEMLAVIDPAFASQLVPLNDEILHVDWEAEPHYYGAFKLQYPGQDGQNQALYYQFLSALTPETDRGVYLAGESVSWQGGWTESALHTGLNAACAVAHRLGAPLPEHSPLRQDPRLYTY